MKKLIIYWEKVYYTEPLLIILLIFSLFIALKNRKKYKALKYIHFYIIALLLVFIFGCGTSFLSWETRYYKIISIEIADHADYIFTYVELFIFSNFYYRLTDKKATRKGIIILNIGFLIFFILMLLSDPLSNNGISDILKAQVYTTESIVLLIICLQHSIVFFKKSASLALPNDPVFWITTGLLIFLTCTLPFSFLENYIRNNYPNALLPSYSIFYFFYILLFLTVIRAYLCKPGKV